MLAGAAGLAGTLIGPARLAAGAGLVTGFGLSGCTDDAATAGNPGPIQTTSPSSGAATTDPPLATVAEIPVGSGRVFEAERVVLVRPAQDEILGYSSVCTHAACVLTVLSADRLQCPCHRSVFDTADGSVLSGPAPRPLPAREIVVEGGEIRLA
ncbi:MAG TPA: Rieske (2Fe-2S) protein [Actinomycetes bacterium]|nr:Rieske (2Fe-2S) protein [Actinomycetes bacterium]